MPAQWGTRRVTCQRRAYTVAETHCIHQGTWSRKFGLAMGLALAVPEPRVEDEGSEAVSNAVEDDREVEDEDEGMQLCGHAVRLQE